VWFLYPETRGYTLEEIDGLFVKDSATTQELVEKAKQIRHFEEKGNHSGSAVDEIGADSGLSKYSA
jgi:hypothetical protein